VNLAVEQAASAGVLTAVSLMIGAPWAGDAVRIARQHPQLRVGLHLVLTDGVAVLGPAEIPRLVGADRRFLRSLVSDAWRYPGSARMRAQARAEIRAQFAAFADTGLQLDHVNTHHHFHLHPLLLQIIVEVGRAFGLRAVRLPAEPLWFAASCGMPQAAAAALLAPWVGWLRSGVRRAGLAANDHVFGVSCTGRFDADTFTRVLQRLPQGMTEIFLHPRAASGERDASVLAGSELAALLDPRVGAVLRSCGATTGGFADLLG
jgi:chitin disaccharide deacetylase